MPYGNCKKEESADCLLCGKVFSLAFPSHKKRRKYCSLKCAYNSPERVSHITKKDRGTRICKGCGIEFLVTTRSPNPKFCTQPCSAKFIGVTSIHKNRRTITPFALLEKTCFCGKKFTHQRSAKRKFCSMKCSAGNIESIKKRIESLNMRENKESSYSRCQSGWHEIGGTRCFYRSSWEANYAHYLQWLKEHGEIKQWEHEPKTFWFESIKRGVRSYLPDFRVTLGSGIIEWHEVKGWMDARSKTKIKRMAKYHPKETLRILDAKWFKSANKKLSGIVPGWNSARVRGAKKKELK